MDTGQNLCVHWDSAVGPDHGRHARARRGTQAAREKVALVNAPADTPQDLDRHAVVADAQQLLGDHREALQARVAQLLERLVHDRLERVLGQHHVPAYPRAVVHRRPDLRAQDSLTPHESDGAPAPSQSIPT